MANEVDWQQPDARQATRWQKGQGLAPQYCRRQHGHIQRVGISADTVREAFADTAFLLLNFSADMVSYTV